jgi:hypothetical protein
MPVTWTAENDRKLLLLMLKSTDCKISYPGTHYLFYQSDTIVVQSLWGPDPPTVKSISHRMAVFKKFARDHETSTVGTPTTYSPRKRGGLVTPGGSPQAPSKRPSDSDEFEFTPRRAPKRQAKRVLKYSEPEIENCGNEKWFSDFKETDVDSDEDDEWSPKGENVYGAETRVKTEIVDEIEEQTNDSIWESSAIVEDDNIFAEQIKEMRNVVKVEVIA